MGMPFSGVLTETELKIIKQAFAQKMLSFEEEEALSHAWLDHGDVSAFQKLLLAFDRLVVSISLRYRKYGVPIADLIQEGRIGVMQASQKFDPNLHIRFGTYVKWWILSAIQRYIMLNWSIVRHANTSQNKALFFKLSHISLQDSDDKNQSWADQMAKQWHVNPKDITEMQSMFEQPDLSIYYAHGDDQDHEIVDLFPSYDLTPEAHMLIQNSHHEQECWIEEGMKRLDEREVFVITEHRLKEPAQTLEMIGSTLNISKERVRQLEASAMRKMKKAYENHVADILQVL